MEKLLLKVEEVAAAIGMSRSLVYQLVAAGTIPSVRIGQSVRVPAQALRDWAKAVEAKAGEAVEEKT